jgi:NDP-sugar pyrophosphorylase family protein
MRAMILAAGLGTRLQPITDTRPKALVEIAGYTLLEITLRRLREFGIGEVIINVHHFADMVVDYLGKNDNFGMRIEISREDELLDTGGGLKKAAWFFLEDGSDEPFLLHNVDVLSTIDFLRMLEFHRQHNALATLAVQKREASRYLMFDRNKQLRGRGTRCEAKEESSSTGDFEPLAFSGVHVVSPRFLSMMTEQGAFSIIDTYVRLAAEGQKILAFRADDCYWRDLGKPENLAQAGKDVQQGLLQIQSEEDYGNAAGKGSRETSAKVAARAIPQHSRGNRKKKPN